VRAPNIVLFTGPPERVDRLRRTDPGRGTVRRGGGACEKLEVDAVAPFADNLEEVRAYLGIGKDGSASNGRYL
jgi:hypothetical protein